MYPDDHFTGANFMAQITVGDRNELFERLCRRITELPEIKSSKITYETIYQAISDREMLGTTAIGSGVILPHARITGLEHLGTVIATLKNPLPNDDPDHTPLRIACLLLIPADKPMEGLKFIARFANYIQMPELREALIKAATPDEMQRQLEHLNKVSRKAIIAGDIMAKPSVVLAPEQPLKEATTLMAGCRASVAPVLEGRRLVGQIVCTNLFTLGIPDFFSQLKSVGFIRFFDPFEKYFNIEARSTVGEVMTSDFCKFYEDATLIEVVFAISILKYPQVYVVNKDQELLGIIDQSLLLEKIINL